MRRESSKFSLQRSLCSGKGGGGGGAHAALASDTGQGRRLASRLGGESSVRGSGLYSVLNQLSLDKDRNDLASVEAERLVVQNCQNAANLTRVAGDADPSVVVVRKDIVNDNLATRNLVGRSLALVLVTAPQQVVL